MKPPLARESATTVALVAVTAAWNVLQNRILPRWAYVPANLVGTAGALALGSCLGLDETALGTSRERMIPGVTTGCLVGAPVAAAILGAERSPRMRPLFADERAAGVATGALAYETVVRIPLGTALFEETLFRGLLLAWLCRRTTPLRAVSASSALFGLWHILPTWETLAGYAGGVLRSRSGATAAAAAGGAVVTTGLAGAAFSALRLRSGSLAAPVIVHATVNAAGFVAAWSSLRRRS